jgi:LuxR family maltose regulon positive regulatory protein
MATASRVATKLQAPKIRGRLITRERIIRLLNFDPDQSLVIICAPAGYGKSTAVAQWLSLQPEPSVWISADPDDADVVAFLTLLVEAANRLDPILLGPTHRLLDDNHVGGEAIIRQLVEDLSELREPLIVVVDDYHLIESPELNRTLVRLLENLPWQLRLVLVTRNEPSLPIARLRASGEVLEIGLADLRFDQHETSRFLESRGHHLTSEHQHLIHSATEGWAVALNLSSLAIKGSPDTESIEEVAEMEGSSLPHLSQYLWQEVIEGLEPAVRAFLIRVSLLDRFSVELCNALTGERNAAAMIARCEEGNLFISRIDVHHIWHRFHHLFVDVLREMLHHELPPNEIARLHVRASQWLESHGFMLTAIQHAIAGGDWNRAVSLLETVATVEFEADRILDLHQWLRIAPLELLQRSPRLAFYLAWAQVRLGHLQEAPQTISIAESAYRSTTDASGMSTVHLWRAVDGLTRGRYAEAVSCGRAALEGLSSDQATERYLTLAAIGMGLSFQGLPNHARPVFAELRLQTRQERRQWIRLMESVHGGYAVLLEGNLNEAAEVINRAISEAGPRISYIWLQPARLYLGIIALQQRRLEEAETHLRQAMQNAIENGSSNWKTRIYLALARLERANGNFEAAFDYINEAIEEATGVRSAPIVSEARALEAELRIARNQISLATRWVESSEIDQTAAPDFEQEPGHLAYSRYLIATGNATDALPILENLRITAAEDGRKGSLIGIGILKSLALKELGDSAEAVAALQETLDLASELGIVQAFFDEWDALAPLLRHIAAREHHRGYAFHLLSLAEEGPLPPAASQPAMVEEISRREIEVLRLVSVGMSNREIGNRLYISEKTVKKHVSNIMAKLGTSNRTQTADLARQMGLL